MKSIPEANFVCNFWPSLQKLLQAFQCHLVEQLDVIRARCKTCSFIGTVSQRKNYNFLLLPRQRQSSLRATSWKKYN